MQPNESTPVAWYLTKKSVFLGLAIFGPLALPLVWMSPKFSRTQRIVLTVITVVLTVLFFKFTAMAVGLLNKQVEEMKALGY